MLLFLAFIYGAIIGSFLNVVILRLPKEEKLGGRSHCVHCGHILGALELVPILSFLVLGGKCRNCRGKISWRYISVELSCALLFMLAAAVFGLGSFFAAILFVKACAVIAVLTVVFVVDLEHFVILDKVIFPAMGLVLLLNIAASLAGKQPLWAPTGYALGGILGALLFSLPFFLVWYFSNGGWMGFGDVKLALLLGLIAGLPNFVVALLLSVFIGGAFAVILLISTKMTLKSKVPFGTFLSLGTLIALFYGGKLLSWYLALLGF